MLRLAHPPSFAIRNSKRRPYRNCRIQQIVSADTGRTILKVAVDARENGTEQIEALIYAVLNLLPVYHGAVLR
jgi:hypothetical protein